MMGQCELAYVLDYAMECMLSLMRFLVEPPDRTYKYYIHTFEDDVRLVLGNDYVYWIAVFWHVALVGCWVVYSNRLETMNTAVAA